VRAAQLVAGRACAPDPRKQGICSIRVQINLFARAGACDMLRAESLAAEAFFSRHFFKRGVE
jgi:hypothetical protein